MTNFLLLILVNLMWSVQFAAAKVATDNLGPVTVTVVPLVMSVSYGPLPGSEKTEAGSQTAGARKPAPYHSAVCVAWRRRNRDFTAVFDVGHFPLTGVERSCHHAGLSRGHGGGRILHA